MTNGGIIEGHTGFSTVCSDLSPATFFSRSRMGNSSYDAHARDTAVAQRLYPVLLEGRADTHANAMLLQFGGINIATPLPITL
jgi:hypothetical protein